MINSGADIAVVSKRMGHSSIRVTADIYGHLFEEAGQQAASASAALVPAVCAPTRPLPRRMRTPSSTADPETNMRASPVGEARRSVSQPDARPKGLEPLTF